MLFVLSGNCCLEWTSLLGLDLHFDGGGRKSEYVKDSAAIFLFFAVLGVLLSTSPSESAVSGMKRTYTTFKSGIWDRLLHEGPCSPAKISQTRFFPILGRKCLSQALLMFPIVISSLSSKGTNSLGPILVYFCAFPATSADKR